MFWTEYSRCSLGMVQTVRFLDILSSSLSRKFPNQAVYHRSSQLQIRGLSVEKVQVENVSDKCPVYVFIISFLLFLDILLVDRFLDSFY